MRLWMIVGVALLLAGCDAEDGSGSGSGSVSVAVDDCKDRPRCSILASDDDSSLNADELIDDVTQGKLSVADLTAALNDGHIEVKHVEQGYSSVQLFDLLRQQLRPAYASSPDECRVVGVGSRPCGGPERFMIYSTANTNEPLLQDLVGAYNRKRAADNRRERIVSDCRVVPRPAVVLRDGMCRAAETATH